MQRRSTKQSRGANSQEKAFHRWAKDQGCVICFTDGPSILDHYQGSSKKMYFGIARVMVGHWLLLPLCPVCDGIKTNGSLRAFNDQFGEWLSHWMDFICNSPIDIPDNVIGAVNQQLSIAHE